MRGLRKCGGRNVSERVRLRNIERMRLKEEDKEEERINDEWENIVLYKLEKIREPST